MKCMIDKTITQTVSVSHHRLMGCRAEGLLSCIDNVLDSTALVSQVANSVTRVRDQKNFQICYTCVYNRDCFTELNNISLKMV